MVRLLKFAVGALLFTASIAMTLAGISPEVAESNLKAWLDLIQLGHLGEGFTKTTDHWVFWIGAAVLVLSLAIVVTLLITKRRPKELQEQEERIYTTKTAGDLFSSVSDLTELEMQRFVQPHIGKWIRVQSVVQDMRTEGDFVVVWIGQKFDPTSVLWFEKDAWLARLETMSLGHNLAACGRIQKIGLIAMTLVDCEIVDEVGENDAFRRPSTRGQDARH